jgi:hypothetical protein
VELGWGQSETHRSFLTFFPLHPLKHSSFRIVSYTVTWLKPCPTFPSLAFSVRLLVLTNYFHSVKMKSVQKFKISFIMKWVHMVVPRGGHLCVPME